MTNVDFKNWKWNFVNLDVCFFPTNANDRFFDHNMEVIFLNTEV